MEGIERIVIKQKYYQHNNIFENYEIFVSNIFKLHNCIVLIYCVSVKKNYYYYFFSYSKFYREGKARQGRARQGKARQGKARQGKAR